MTSKLTSTVSKIWGSGLNVVVVPWRPLALPMARTSPVGLPKLVTMPADAWAALDAICAERGCSRGEIVESLIHEEAKRESAKGERP